MNGDVTTPAEYYSAMTRCPRYSHCTVLICPLDLDKDKRDPCFDISGKQRKCTLSKNMRMKLGKDLPGRGLWPRELAGLERWERMTPQEQAERLTLLSLWGKEHRIPPREGN